MKDGPKLLRRNLYLALLIGWAALTFTLTSLPNPEVNVPLPYFDKIVHFGFYGVMGFLCALWQRECGRSPKAAVLAALFFIAVTGAVDEVHQHFIPGRSMDLFDWFADAGGGGMGALFSLLLPLLFPFLLTE